jgi:hypothetical protein
MNGSPKCRYFAILVDISSSTLVLDCYILLFFLCFRLSATSPACDVAELRPCEMSNYIFVTS